MIGHIFGCHSCGIRHPPEPGLWVADHQPPNNIAKGKANEPLRHVVFRLTGGRLGGRPPQQFYPHCLECSNLQVRSTNPDQSENGEAFACRSTAWSIQTRVGYSLCTECGCCVFSQTGQCREDEPPPSGASLVERTCQVFLKIETTR